MVNKNKLMLFENIFLVVNIRFRLEIDKMCHLGESIKIMKCSKCFNFIFWFNNNANHELNYT